MGCLKLSGRAWCLQELGVGGRGGRGCSAQGRGQRADLGCEDPRARDATASFPLRTDAHFPLFMLVQDSHSFQLCTPGIFHRLCLNQSLLCGLPGGQPCLSGPIAWGWRLQVQKRGPPRVPPSPDFALVGVKMGDRRGVGGGHSKGYPQCLLRSPRWGWERGL